MKLNYISAGILLACSAFQLGAQNWVTGQSHVVPADAIVGGHEATTSSLYNGPPLYVCRGGLKEGEGLQIGKFRADFSGCDIGFKSTETTVNDFEILVTSWENASYGFVPANAVAGGYDAPSGLNLSGPALYYCRGYVGSSLQPGKIRPGFTGCAVAYGGQSINLTSYQVLVGLNPAMPLSTVGASNGYVPPEAVRGGTDSNGEALYICSALYAGGTHPGKIRRDLGACLIPWGWASIAGQDYAVLVPNWESSTALSGTNTTLFDFPVGWDIDGISLRTPMVAGRRRVGTC